METRRPAAAGENSLKLAFSEGAIRTDNASWFPAKYGNVAAEIHAAVAMNHEGSGG